MIATAKLVETFPEATVFAAGDNVYQDGTTAEYRDCYDPHWGRFKDRTWPVPGNHEYGSDKAAAPYFAYFGAAAGEPGKGYWRRTLGTWTVLGLNSDGQNLAGQIAWLKTELSANKTNCTLAIWHRPLFSAGNNPDATDMGDTWQALYDLGVDVVVNGHEHLYQRYDPQDANGNFDPAKGMRQFTVGTGGASLYGPVVTHRNSAKFVVNTFGVAKFTLLENAYTWEFINIDRTGESDSGSGVCHF